MQMFNVESNFPVVNQGGLYLSNNVMIKQETLINNQANVMINEDEED